MKHSIEEETFNVLGAIGGMLLGLALGGYLGAILGFVTGGSLKIPVKELWLEKRSIEEDDKL